MGIRGILKKDGVARRKKRNLKFSKTINHIQEFDEDLPVLTITKPNYLAPYDPTDDDDDIMYWWEMDDEVVDWDDDENEWNIEGYTWDDVVEETNLTFRSDAFEDAYFEQSDDSSSDDDSSSAGDSSSYDEETVSDYDSEYQDDLPQTPVQLDVEALKAEQKRLEGVPRLVLENDLPDSSTRSARSLPDRPVDATPKILSLESSDNENMDASGRSSQGGPRRARPRRTSKSTYLVQTAKAVAKELAPSLDIKPEPPSPVSPKPVSASGLLEQRPAAALRTQSLVLPGQTPRMSDRVAKPELDPILPENPERLSLTLKDSSETLLSPLEVVTPTSVSTAAAAAVAASILSSLQEDPVVITEEPQKKVKRNSSNKSKGSKGSSSDKANTAPSLDKNGLKKKKKKEKRESDPSITNKVKHLKRQPRPEGVDDPNAVKDYSWEKPDWSKENKLKQTKRGRMVRKGANLAKPITMINRALNDMMDARLLAWGKPEWAKKAEMLKQTQLGNAVKSGGSLARKITHIASDPEYRKALGWEKPEWTEKKMVKETEKGRAVKKGECISRAITHIRDDEEVTTKYAWEKPEWATKKIVRSTKEGEKVKKGEYLSTGITNNQEAKDKYGWEKPAWTQAPLVKRVSTLGSVASSKSEPGGPIKRSSTMDSNEDKKKSADDNNVENGQRRSSYSRYKRTSSLPK